MTLILAIGCDDGVVLASDSSGSDAESGIQQLHPKVKQLENQPILYAGSGDVGLLQKIDENLSGFSPRNNLKNTRKEIKKCVLPELQESVRGHVRYPQPPFHQPPIAILLFVGVLENKYWIIEIERDGRDTYYGKEFGFFCAIGSGKPLAQALFIPYLHTKRNLQLGKIFAFRVLDDAISLSAGGLDRPIHIYTIDLNGKIENLNENELRELSDSCQLWRELEWETVGKLLTRIHGDSSAPEEKEEPEAEIPKPDS